MVNAELIIDTICLELFAINFKDYFFIIIFKFSKSINFKEKKIQSAKTTSVFNDFSSSRDITVYVCSTVLSVTYT